MGKGEKHGLEGAVGADGNRGAVQARTRMGWVPEGGGSEKDTTAAAPGPHGASWLHPFTASYLPISVPGALRFFLTYALNKISSPDGKWTLPTNIYIWTLQEVFIYIYIYIWEVFIYIYIYIWERERVMNSRIIKFLLLSFSRAHCNLNSNNRKSTG